MNLLLLFSFSAPLAMVAVALLAFVAAFTWYFGRLTLALERRRQDVQGRIAGLVFQMVGGIAKLRVAAAERRAFAVWAQQFSVQQRIDFREGLNRAAVTTLNATLPLLSTLVLFGVAGHRMQTGNPIAPATFVAFVAAFGAFFASGTQLSGTLVSLMSIGPILERARPILATPPEVDAARPDPGELTGAIEGSHLTFRYRADGPVVLDDVSFRVRPGEFVAVVGPSGSGKSTILRLLLGFEQAESGKLFYDNQALDTVDVTAVRSQIGAVLQSSQLMAGSIFKNIVGMAPLTQDDAWAAAAAAGLAEDIRDMPMGMNTVLGEGATTLSGGQRQRLLIARALARKPRIIFFDEATSALDNRTQELVARSLEASKATRLVIAHRLSTIRNADRIYVVERGRIVQEGSFEELVAREGLFARLVARQIA
jgi:ABC-type bacteriocin/lantibiotic exporter with double-glycine peptidase domain